MKTTIPAFRLFVLLLFSGAVIGASAELFMTVSKRARVLAVLIILAAAAIVPTALAATGPPPVFMNSQFSGFDAIDYIRRNHPSLESQAESISHWSAYYNVNPILLINVVKVHDSLQLPIAGAIKTLASSLGSLATRQSRTSRSESTFSPTLVNELDRLYSFGADTAAKVIDLTRLETASAGLTAALTAASDTPPALDLPFTRPQSWQFNGVHTWTGSGDDSPMSSLDFTRTWSLVWGDDTSEEWVTSAHDGEVTVYSSCFVQVQHDNGWATRYYHLDNIQVETGQHVQAGELLANYTSEKDQALCSGGSSTSPHLHFALLRDGGYYSLQDIALSGYIIHPGTSSYDTDHSRMWLEKRGTRYYAFALTIAQEEGDNIIDYRYNGMWYSPDNNGHGLNIEITEFADNGGTRKTVFIVMYTYDDEGQANFYVGNRDFDRWRSDVSLVVDMLQTSGGDFSTLAPIDFDDPGDVAPAGQAELQFLNCNEALIYLDLDERSSGQPVEHSISLIKLIGVPEHVCEAASLGLPEP
jgi:hypothetical protein